MNNLGSKHSRLMNFGQFIYYKRKKIIKKLYNFDLKTSSRPFCDHLKLLFRQNFLKIKKDLELGFTRMCLLPKLFSKMRFVFHAWAFDDVMTFEYLKS